MAAWPGHLRQKAEQSQRDLRGALIREVLRRGAGRAHTPLPVHDSRAFTRRKVKPMVYGLFPGGERDTVLDLLVRSVTFLTHDNVEQLLLEMRWNHTAWTLANLHLATLGAPLLSAEALPLVGLSEETKCYVSPKYFSDPEPASDFLVHEVAHIFHNSKRATAGLTETRTKEWLLDIDYSKRETFAYASEFYSWILEHARDSKERRRLAAEMTSAVSLTDDRVDADEVAAIVGEAAVSRGGWKVILRHCE